MKDEMIVKMVQKHNELKTKLDFYKEKEMEARLELCGLMTSETGSHNQLIRNVKIKVVNGLNIRIDSDEYESMKEHLSEKASSCVKLKPTLSKGEYNKLSDEDRDMVDEFLIIKPSAPSLSYQFAEDQ